MANYIQKSSVKKLVKDKGFRISPSSYDGINRSVESIILQMLEKVDQDGMKTLMDQHTGITKKAKVVKSKSCTRCCMIKEQFIQWARATQDWCITKATTLSRQV